MNAPGRFFVFADALEQGPFGIFHVLLGDFAGHGTVVVGNVFHHLPMFFPRRCQAAGIVHGNGAGSAASRSRRLLSISTRRWFRLA